MYSLLRSKYGSLTIKSHSDIDYPLFIRNGYIVVNTGTEKQMEAIKKAELEMLLLN